MNKLVVKNLSKSFGKNIIFEKINFDLKKGEILSIIGNSGSGKTTLLQCISLLEIADFGEISIDNLNINFSHFDKNNNNIKEIKSKIGIVFQDFNLWPHMSVIENLIEAPIQVNKETKINAKKRAIALLKKFGLDYKSEAMPETLSGGQKQRVAIARALMMKPTILLFDEPTSALDPKMVSILVEIIRELAKDNITIIIASHEIPFVKQISNKVIFISKNKIIEQGTIDILNNPSSKELNQFLNNEKDQDI